MILSLIFVTTLQELRNLEILQAFLLPLRLLCVFALAASPQPPFHF